MFGKKKEEITLPALPETPERSRIPEFIEFQGAAGETDDTGKLSFYPRGTIMVNPERIDAYYDNTVLIGGHKIRVMDTVRQVSLKILEARAKER